MPDLNNITVTNTQLSVDWALVTHVMCSGHTKTPRTAQEKRYTSRMRTLAKALLSRYHHRVSTRDTPRCARFCQALHQGCCRLNLYKGERGKLSALYTFSLQHTRLNTFVAKVGGNRQVFAATHNR